MLSDLVLLLGFFFVLLPCHAIYIFMFMQITFSLLFSLVIAFISDALSAVPDKASVLSHDASFRHEFHEIVRQNAWLIFLLSVNEISDEDLKIDAPSVLQVMAAGNDPNVQGFVDSTRLAWAVHLMLIQDAITARNTISSASSSDLGYLQSCLEAIFSNNVFQFILDKVLRTAAYQVGL